MGKITGKPFLKAHIAYTPKKCEGEIVGHTIRVVPAEVKVPMSQGEALAIAMAIKPGALFKLHQQGRPDWVALRALEVARV